MNGKRTKRTSRLLTLWLALAGLCLNACTTEEPSQTYRVGILSGVEVFASTIEGFKARMEELGYVEGENITYDVQSAEGDTDRMTQIAQQFVADDVDLIFTTTTGGALAAQAATADTDVPVVFTIVVDPVGGGILNDLRQPGGNVTGVSRPLTSFLSKRVETLVEIDPTVEYLWVPYNPDYSTANVSLPAVREAASVLGLTLIETPVSSPEDVLSEIERLSALDAPGFQAIQIMPDSTVQNATSWEALLAFANERGLPILANVPGQVEQGALLTHSDDNFETGEIAAPIADQVLKGADPGLIPVALSEPRLYINYAVAQRLGLEIDDGLLSRADEVIR